MSSLDENRERLRAAGLRVTNPRLAVLTELTGGGHPTVDSLADAVRARIGAVSTQAVYDVLGALVETGLARVIEPAGSARRYEARVADNHHHLVCRTCGHIEDVDCAEGEAPCLVPGESHGFTLHEAEITWWGTCGPCRSAGERVGAVGFEPTTPRL
ncbi:Fur family transcriptional regulator [Cryptosporangium sp. NPDC048952]|uniref:Fur family transcriptional regulator n=1 Tax=Cryptosporangium sp. NPDC048952 TaxID=3363961 RepID=UPI0037102FDC